MYASFLDNLKSPLLSIYKAPLRSLIIYAIALPSSRILLIHLRLVIPQCLWDPTNRGFQRYHPPFSHLLMFASYKVYHLSIIHLYNSYYTFDNLYPIGKSNHFFYLNEKIIPSRSYYNGTLLRQNVT